MRRTEAEIATKFSVAGVAAFKSDVNGLGKAVEDLNKQVEDLDKVSGMEGFGKKISTKKLVDLKKAIDAAKIALEAAQKASILPKSKGKQSPVSTPVAPQAAPVVPTTPAVAPTASPTEAAVATVGETVRAVSPDVAALTHAIEELGRASKEAAARAIEEKKAELAKRDAERVAAQRARLPFGARQAFDYSGSMSSYRSLAREHVAAFGRKPDDATKSSDAYKASIQALQVAQSRLVSDAGKAAAALTFKGLGTSIDQLLKLDFLVHKIAAVQIGKGAAAGVKALGTEITHLPGQVAAATSAVTQSAVKIGGAFAEASKTALKALGRVTAEIKELASKSIKISVAASIAGGISATGVIKKSLDSYQERGAGVQEMANTLGISYAEASTMAAAANTYNVAVEDLTKGLVHVSRAMQDALIDPAGDMAQAFNNLGVSLTNADGRMRSVTDVFNQIAVGQGNTGGFNPARSKALTDTIGDDQVIKLSKFYNALGDAAQRGQNGYTPALAYQAQKGLLLTSNDVAMADRYHFAVKGVKDSFAGIGIEIAREIAPSLTQLLNMFGTWIDQHRQDVVDFFVGTYRKSMLVLLEVISIIKDGVFYPVYGSFGEFGDRLTDMLFSLRNFIRFLKYEAGELAVIFWPVTKAVQSAASSFGGLFDGLFYRGILLDPALKSLADKVNEFLWEIRDPFHGVMPENKFLRQIVVLAGYAQTKFTEARIAVADFFSPGQLGGQALAVSLHDISSAIRSVVAGARDMQRAWKGMKPDTGLGQGVVYLKKAFSEIQEIFSKGDQAKPQTLIGEGVQQGIELLQALKAEVLDVKDAATQFYDAWNGGKVDSTVIYDIANGVKFLYDHLKEAIGIFENAVGWLDGLSKSLSGVSIYTWAFVAAIFRFTSIGGLIADTASIVIKSVGFIAKIFAADYVAGVALAATSTGGFTAALTAATAAGGRLLLVLGDVAAAIAVVAAGFVAGAWVGKKIADWQYDHSGAKEGVEAQFAANDRSYFAGNDAPRASYDAWNRMHPDSLISPALGVQAFAPSQYDKDVDFNSDNKSPVSDAIDRLSGNIQKVSPASAGIVNMYLDKNSEPMQLSATDEQLSKLVQSNKFSIGAPASWNNQ